MVVPIIADLERDGDHSFHFMAGSVELAEVAGFGGSFVSAPHLRFLESAWPGATDEQLRSAVSGAPGGLTPEDTLRYLERRLPSKTSRLLQDVLLDIRRRFEEEGPFDCILGHSDGAVIAATFVVGRLNESAEGNKMVVPKCAVFLNGAAPHTADGKGWLLADECGRLITIPTCHVVAWNDALVDQSIALYHLCEEDLASIVDHGRGHAIPRDDKSCKLIVRAIRDLVERTGDSGCIEVSREAGGSK